MSKRHHSIIPILVFILFLIGTLLGLGLVYLNFILSPVNNASSTPITFVVNKGDSITTISSHLNEAGLTRSLYSFRLAVYLEKLDNKIQAGEYQLATNMSARALAKSLTKGIAESNTLTIPEGFRLEQIGELAESKLGISYQDFLTAAKGYEGYLFPDTYAFSKDVSAVKLTEKLRTTWDAKVQTLSRLPTRDEVTLASILGRETLTDAEKPVVAGILQKRLAEGWALEVDATIQYILGKKGQWWPIPLLGDRAIKSPYNTYLNRDLPPSPICNPGLVSLKAVLSPEESPYYFYLHDKQGNIHYAATNAEHESNIEKYIR